MKPIKFAIIMVLCLFIFAGCTNVETKETELDSWFDDAMKFDEYEWPDSDISLANKIPIPEWSDHGEISYDIDYLFYIQIGYSTLDDFNNYIKECQKDEYGFNIEQHEESNFRYYAENKDGQAIELLYNSNDKFVSIKVIREPSTWNKWWETEKID